jgi:hypothetical protein
MLHAGSARVGIMPWLASIVLARRNVELSRLRRWLPLSGAGLWSRRAVSFEYRERRGGRAPAAVQPRRAGGRPVTGPVAAGLLSQPSDEQWETGEPSYAWPAAAEAEPTAPALEKAGAAPTHEDIETTPAIESGLPLISSETPAAGPDVGLAQRPASRHMPPGPAAPPISLWRPMLALSAERETPPAQAAGRPLGMTPRLIAQRAGLAAARSPHSLTAERSRPMAGAPGLAETTARPSVYRELAITPTVMPLLRAVRAVRQIGRPAAERAGLSAASVEVLAGGAMSVSGVAPAAAIKRPTIGHGETLRRPIPATKAARIVAASQPGALLTGGSAPAERRATPAESGMAAQPAAPMGATDEDAGRLASPAISARHMPQPPAEAAREWPVLAYLTSRPAEAAMPGEAAQPFAAKAKAAEPAPLAALPAEKRSILRRLPALGGGEPLPAALRRPMETLLGRPLADVRIHVSPLVEALGAEALTTGRRIVFGPGRFAPHTPAGLALLGHELSHVGQALAFRAAAGAASASGDAEEAAARSQEERIERLLREGWPQAPAREVRRAAHVLAPLAERGVAATALPQGTAGAGTPAGESAEAGAPAAAGGAEQPALPIARVSEIVAPPAVGAGGEAGKPNLDKLAQQVYAILKARLRAERERHQVYVHA